MESSIEPISSDPVMVQRNDTGFSVTASTFKSDDQPETLESRVQNLEALLSAQKPTQARNRSRSPSIHVVGRYRYPPSVEDLPVLTSTTALLTLLSKTARFPDTLAEMQSSTGRFNTHMVYVTTLSPLQAELDKLSWIFKIGVEDGWVQKPVSFVGRGNWSYDLPGGLNGSGRRRGGVDCYHDGFGDQRINRGQAPVVKLGVLFTTIFPGEGGDEENESGEEKATGAEKVKFIAVVQGKANSGWTKVLVSYSRMAALVDIFHELVNGLSLIFVGAVLKDEDIPLAQRGYTPKIKEDVLFKKVGSVKEAEEVGAGIMAIIC